MDTILRRDIITFLTPLPALQSESSRRSTLFAAGLDTIAAGTDLSGGPREAVTAIVYALEQHGTVGDTPALAVLLAEIAPQLGDDKQRQIQDFCSRLGGSAPAQTAAPTPSAAAAGITIGAVPATQVSGNVTGDLTGRDKVAAPQIFNVTGDFFENVRDQARVFTGPVTITNDYRTMPAAPQAATAPDALDVELSLDRRGPDTYQVTLRIDAPGNPHINLLGPYPARIPLDELRALELTPDEYGRALGQGLFAAPELRQAWQTARAVAASHAQALRLRLVLTGEASDLHGLFWETLCEPDTGRALLTDEHLRVSRYISGDAWSAVRPALPDRPTALVAVANPADLNRYGLSALDVPAEIQRVRAALPDVSLRVLASNGQTTLTNLLDHLRDGVDLCYLVAHGKLVDDAPWLWLENDLGQTARVSGADLAARMQALTQRPRLLVLASCQSAGTGPADPHALSALGPRLVQAGVPAVIAMQGNLSVRTVETMLPALFRELRRDGRIDRALAVARGAAREQADWYRPALFMRLKDGRLWEIGR